jgi:hypothetical protein
MQAYVYNLKGEDCKELGHLKQDIIFWRIAYQIFKEKIVL